MYRFTSRTLRRAHLTRANSTTTSGQTFVRKRPTVRDLMKTPVFKSIFLTLVFGTAVVDFMKNRKELETLVNAHNSKFVILEEIIERVSRNEHVDIARELRIANTLTRNNYNTVTDIELDEQLENFLKMTEESVEESVVQKEDPQVEHQEVEDSVVPVPRPIETKKFL
ncbi:hypothetical protein G9P44_001289 [Scheffersomyces stipitis]|nr:hypothetical protein G9P44_001289 [Scheffersomyces stipitis]